MQQYTTNKPTTTTTATTRDWFYEVYLIVYTHREREKETLHLRHLLFSVCLFFIYSFFFIPRIYTIDYRIRGSGDWLVFVVNN